MRRQHGVQIVPFVIVGVLLLVGCSASNLPDATVTSIPTVGDQLVSTVIQSSPTSAATVAMETVFRDCVWSRKARAWIDTNQNGRWDANEKGLPGIVFVFDSTAYGERNSSDPTDETGTTVLFKLLGGCPESKFEVSVNIPSGYRLTTPEQIQSKYPQDDPPFLFGFVTVEAPPPANGGTTDQIGATPLPTIQRPASAPLATNVPRATSLSADPTSKLPQGSVYSECGWTRIARAWDDRNANGQWEGDEPPLAGVTIVVSGTNAGRAFTYNEITDSQGSTLLSMTLFGCPPAAANVSAEPPPGYTLTTPRMFTSDIKKEDETIQFGFKKK